MNANLWKHPATGDEISIPSWKSNRTLGITLVYEDVESLDWATTMRDRVTALIGRESVVDASWRMCYLTNPDVFPHAVETATWADAIIVAVHEAVELPADLCAWVNAWLPRRGGREGTLVALLGPSASGTIRNVRRYLEGVARRGALAFLLEHRKSPHLPAALP